MRGPGAFDHARALESVDARRECPTTSALTHFRERSRVSLLIADFCTCSSGSMHVLNTMLQRERGVLGGVLLAGGEQRRDPRGFSELFVGIQRALLATRRRHGVQVQEQLCRRALHLACTVELA